MEVTNDLQTRSLSNGEGLDKKIKIETTIIEINGDLFMFRIPELLATPDPNENGITEEEKEKRFQTIKAIKAKFHEKINNEYKAIESSSFSREEDRQEAFLSFFIKNNALAQMVIGEDNKVSRFKKEDVGHVTGLDVLSNGMIIFKKVWGDINKDEARIQYIRDQLSVTDGRTNAEMSFALAIDFSDVDNIPFIGLSLYLNDDIYYREYLKIWTDLEAKLELCREPGFDELIGILKESNLEQLDLESLINELSNKNKEKYAKVLETEEFKEYYELKLLFVRVEREFKKLDKMIEQQKDERKDYKDNNPIESAQALVMYRILGLVKRNKYVPISTDLAKKVQVGGKLTNVGDSAAHGLYFEAVCINGEKKLILRDSSGAVTARPDFYSRIRLLFPDLLTFEEMQYIQDTEYLFDKKTLKDGSPTFKPIDAAKRRELEQFRMPVTQGNGGFCAFLTDANILTCINRDMQAAKGINLSTAEFEANRLVNSLLSCTGRPMLAASESGLNLLNMAISAAEGKNINKFYSKLDPNRRAVFNIIKQYCECKARGKEFTQAIVCGHTIGSVISTKYLDDVIAIARLQMIEHTRVNKAEVSASIPVVSELADSPKIIKSQVVSTEVPSRDAASADSDRSVDKTGKTSSTTKAGGKEDIEKRETRARIRKRQRDIAKKHVARMQKGRDVTKQRNRGKLDSSINPGR